MKRRAHRRLFGLWCRLVRSHLWAPAIAAWRIRVRGGDWQTVPIPTRACARCLTPECEPTLNVDTGGRDLLVDSVTVRLA